MNPILLKTLIQLAASNKKPAPTGTVGNDAHLKNRIVLFADEAVNLPDWGISGLPSMILGAAPQTCLFVSDLDVSDDAKDADDNDTDTSGKDDDEKPAGSVSFSLTIKAPPAPDSPLHARTIVWKLTLPVEGFRDVQTGASSTPVHAPVIKTRIKLGGLEREVEIGLLEMGGLDQPLLIGKDTLSNKFLIRPDRPEDQKAPTAPSVDLTPVPAPAPAPANPAEPDADKTNTDTDQKTPVTPREDQESKSDQDTKSASKDAPEDASDASKATDNADTDTIQDTKQPADAPKTPDPAQSNAMQAAQPTDADDAAKSAEANTDQNNTSPKDGDKTENTAKPDSPSKPEEPKPTQTDQNTPNADTSDTKSAEGEKN